MRLRAFAPLRFFPEEHAQCPGGAHQQVLGPLEDEIPSQMAEAD
jgi:hypothetical protein